MPSGEDNAPRPPTWIIPASMALAGRQLTRHPARRKWSLDLDSWTVQDVALRRPFPSSGRGGLKAMGRYLNFLGLVFCLVLGQASAALAADYEFTTIDFPGAHFSETLGINNVGEVVGAYGAAGPEHGFLLSRGTFSTIDVPGIVVTEENAAGINNRGEIAG